MGRVGLGWCWLGLELMALSKGELEMVLSVVNSVVYSVSTELEDRWLSATLNIIFML